MKIELTVQYHYGTEHLYVFTEAAKGPLGQLTNKRTVSRADVDALRALGHEVVLINTVTV